MIRKLSLMVLTAILVFVSCEQPMDPVIKSVQETNALLQAHQWHVDDFNVEVKDEDVPAPILWNLADSVMKAGMFDLDDMVFDASETRKMKVEFTPNGTNLYYAFNKKLYSPWSMSVGFNYQHNKRYQLTGMYNFLGSRNQFTLGITYRFGIRGKNYLHGLTL
ncbi:hypothetical protein [Maribellus mangrovi]|uniref:hypothetical protein n=1 Tax=Maribellus mangrovi TaxID=3133146 RepID=UPI0030ECB2B6